MQQAIFKTGREENFFTFKEISPDYFTIDKLHILKTAAIQFGKAQIATCKCATAESRISQERLGKIAVLK
jgi:hypothetical protein